MTEPTLEPLGIQLPPSCRLAITPVHEGDEIGWMVRCSCSSFLGTHNYQQALLASVHHLADQASFGGLTPFELTARTLGADEIAVQNLARQLGHLQKLSRQVWEILESDGRQLTDEDTAIAEHWEHAIGVERYQEENEGVRP